VAPTDPLALGLGAGVLALTALVATLIPAWKATRVEPVSALSRSMARPRQI
jgi:ABC-type lipoprotein release transport system permease subunit